MHGVSQVIQNRIELNRLRVSRDLAERARRRSLAERDADYAVPPCAPKVVRWSLEDGTKVEYRGQFCIAPWAIA